MYFNNYQLPSNYQYGGYQQQQSLNPLMTNPSLNGKIVDSIEMVKATDVPIGGYGIYPKADLSEIYIKSWNTNGTTSIMTYQIKEECAVAAKDSLEEKILARLDALESKISNLVIPQPTSAQKKEEININDSF
jgi:hypothetical protein